MEEWQQERNKNLYEQQQEHHQSLKNLKKDTIAYLDGYYQWHISFLVQAYKDGKPSYEFNENKYDQPWTEHKSFQLFRVEQIHLAALHKYLPYHKKMIKKVHFTPTQITVPTMIFRVEFRQSTKFCAVQ